MPNDLTRFWDFEPLLQGRSSILIFWIALSSLFWILVACQPPAVESNPRTTPEVTPSKIVTAKATPALTGDMGSEDAGSPPASITAPPTSTSDPTPTITATSFPTPTPTAIGPCSARQPGDDLLTLVTLDYGLSRDYGPNDLVDLSNRLPVTITLGYPTQVRQVILEPLSQMIEDMVNDGLQPQIISGHRSYSAQAIAWSKWLEKTPDSAAIVSAPPGHSEHQLGTTVDFGSPELGEIVGDEDIEFHTYFYKTSEGQWLEQHAHEYGFTLSYSREAFELTGLYYEPWHYRFVGPELAKELKEHGISLAEYLLESYPAPCIP